MSMSMLKHLTGYHLYWFNPSQQLTPKYDQIFANFSSEKQWERRRFANRYQVRSWTKKGEKLTDNLILDFVRISAKHNMANTKQNNLRDAAERVNNETEVEAKFETATEVHAANTCTKLMVKKSFVE